MSLRKTFLGFIDKKKVVKKASDLSIAEGTWIQCPECSETFFHKKLAENWNVCLKCSHHFLLPSLKRVNLLVDKGTFEPLYDQLKTVDILNFKSTKSYKDKLEIDKKKTKMNEAVVVGKGKIAEKNVVLCIMEPAFIMGSLGVVVGEKITRAVEFATEQRWPLIIVSASGGARMQEGIFFSYADGKNNECYSTL